MPNKINKRVKKIHTAMVVVVVVIKIITNLPIIIGEAVIATILSMIKNNKIPIIVIAAHQLRVRGSPSAKTMMMMMMMM